MILFKCSRFHKPRLAADKIIEKTHAEIAADAKKNKENKEEKEKKTDDEDPFAGFSEAGL